jgi:predicted ATPase/class 3 adenylate cyclase
MDAAGPSTHLTFLFTDIEASSRAWEAQPASMSLALARHDELLQTAVKTVGGSVFKHTGDGVCAAFPTAPAAAAAALAAQQALHTEDWDAGPLRVRMALHSGTVERRDADFFGPPLNRTARLLSTAHGGQVVLSLVTAELVREDLPDGADLLDLGEHRLADLSRPERVYQLTHPELPSTFPALRSLTTRRHNLPVATSSNIGREQEHGAVTHLVRSSRLVTLIGIGGVGKTRLALQVAAGLTEAFPDGVFLVDLAPLADPAMVAAQVGRTIGVVEAKARREPEELVDGLCEHLGERAMLVLLDNCEHLVDAVARLADAILARCPDVAVLATSREPLAIAGEILWRVPSLTMPPEDGAMTEASSAGDAVTLFCERARAVDAGFTLDADNAAAVARICRRVDGIPLAMELAAARIRVLSVDQVADRLDDCFRVLSVGPRTAAARQQTFRATMDWSYDLLPSAEQVLLQRLSVFAGSFDLEAVEGVAADENIVPAGEVLDLLSRLVDKSLVSVQGPGPHGRPPHYRLLETVRQYAAEKLTESGAEGDIRRRHHDFYVEIAHSYINARDPFSDAFWLVRFGLSYDNLRTALDWSLSNGDAEGSVSLALILSVYWVLGGYFVEGRARLEQALARSGASHSRARMRALNMLGFLVVQQGEMDLSVSLHTEALALAREAGDIQEAGVGAFYLGARVLHRGELDRAGELLREAIESFRSSAARWRPSASPVAAAEASYAGSFDNLVGELGANDGVAWCEMMLGWVAIAGGDRSAAGRHFEAALEIGSPGAGNLRAHALGGAALLAAEAGDGERAEALAQEAVDAARAIGLQTILVMTLTRAAEVAILLARWERAQAMLAELFTVLRNTGGHAFLADALEMAGVLQDVRGQSDSAAHLLAAADHVRRQSNETADHRPVTPLLEACRHRLAEPLHLEEPVPFSIRDPATFALRELEAPASAVPGGPPKRVQPGAPTTGLLRRAGRHWLVGYGDVRFELPDAKGLGYLSRLLAEPDREIHVLDLVGAGPADPGDAGPVLDEQAKSAYRRRVRELQQEIDEAQAWNDPERAARAEAELEAVTHELAAGVGLGGRDRKAAANAERARVSVRKAITASVAQIRERDTDLGLLLSTTVRTGTYCRYTPDPRLPVTWDL